MAAHDPKAKRRFLEVFGEISATERRLLEKADDKVHLVLQWITEGIGCFTEHGRRERWFDCCRWLHG